MSQLINNFLVNSENKLNLIRGSSLSPEIVFSAVSETHNTLNKIKEFEVDIFQILGVRNLSAFIGETFCVHMAKLSSGLFKKNPHIDGYPDLLLMDDLGESIYKKHGHELQEKKPFSPFIPGGIEVKATCGSVPTGKKLAKKGLKKPEMYDQRIEHLQGYTWHAHHRQTNNLLGLYWDFIAGAPFICAAFYSNDLTENDWSEITLPNVEKETRTTSVSNLTRLGVQKLYDGWILCINDTKYIDFFNQYNSKQIIPSSNRKLSFDDLLAQAI